MITKNSILRDEALKALKGKWKVSILAYFSLIFAFLIYYFLVLSFLTENPLEVDLGTSLTINLINALFLGPMYLGFAFFSLSISRNQQTHYRKVFFGFGRQFPKAFIAYILLTLIISLGLIVFIIPGIIVAIVLSQTFFILADEPNISIIDAMQKSNQMMKGYKMKYFLMLLHILGWSILCIFTLGFGYFWLVPYQSISLAKFYDDIKNTS